MKWNKILKILTLARLGLGQYETRWLPFPSFSQVTPRDVAVTPYFSQILDHQEEIAQVDLDCKKPLELTAQDPFLTQHVPYINCMSIGPTTRPCIDTVLGNPGTSNGHLTITGKDECTSRWQRTGEDDTDDLEQEAWMPPASGRGLMMEDFKAPH